MIRLRSRLLHLVASLPALAPALHAGGEVPLSRGVPENVHFFTGFRSSPEADALNAQYAAAAKRLWDSGMAWDVLDLVTAGAPARVREQARATVERVLGVLGKVAWGELFAEEGAFAFRIGMPMPEYLVLLRVPAADLPRHAESLRGLFREIAAFAPEKLEVRDREGETAKTSALLVKEAPFGLHLGTVGNVIALSTSQPIFASSLRLLGAGNGEGSIALSPTFTRALELLPKERDSEGYFDLGGMCEFVAGGMGMARANARGEGAAILDVFTALLGEVGTMRTITWAQRTSGSRDVIDSVLLFEPGSAGRFFPRLLGAGRTLEKFERLAPKEATAFSASAGFDPAGAYDALLAAIGENATEGEGILEAWKGIQAKIGFDLRADLLSWLSGGCVAVCLPASKPGLFGGTDGVLGLRVKDAAATSARMNSILEKAAAFLQERGQEIRLEALPGIAGLREVRLEAFPDCRPVVGVEGDLLVLASSPEAAQKFWAARQGKAPNILEREGFKGLRLGLDGPVASVHYADVAGSLRGLSQLLSGLGFCGSLLPRNRDTRPLLKAGAVLTKLGRFLREIDLEVDRGGFSRPLKGAEGIHYRTVRTFRRPI